MGGTTVTASESRSQRLSKPRTNTSSTNLLKVTEQHREPSSPISPSDTHMFGDESTVITSRSGDTRSRRRARSKLRAYLYGAGQDNAQSCSSGEEDPEQKGLVDIARGVKGRLSRVGTGTSIQQLPSAEASSTQLSNVSSSKLMLLHDDRLDLEESERMVREIKEKAHADSLAAQNHVAPPVDEDLHVDAVMSPIRRRSLYTPGIATRTPDDILRKPPPPVTLQSQADRDYYYNPKLPQSSPLGQLATLEIAEGGRSTPSNLDYSHLGGLKLGTLRVTNGAASPAPTEINPLGMHPPKPESADHDDFFTASEGGGSFEESHCSVTNHPSLRGSRHIPVFQAGPDQHFNRINTIGECHDEAIQRAQNSGSPLKYERQPEECLVAESIRHEDSRVSLNESFSAYSNVPSKSPDRALYIAQDYMQDIPGSPYSFVESSSYDSSNLEHLTLGEAADKESSGDEGVVMSRFQRPTVNLWRSFIDDAEARHANDGTREDALRKLTANAASQSEFAVRPVSSSAASRNTKRLDNNTDSLTAGLKNNADSGYSSSESVKSFDRSAFGGSAGELIQEHSKISQPRVARCVSGPRDMPQSLQSGTNKNTLEQTTKQDLARPPMLIIPNVETEPPILVTHAEEIKAPVAMPRPKSFISSLSSAEARKLRKARRSSQPNPADFVTVQCIGNLGESNIPPVPIETVAKHLERLNKFPLLEHTFPSLQHVRSDEDLYAEEPIAVPIRFPSPSDSLQRGDSIIRSNLDWPSSRPKKSKKSSSIFHRSPTRTPKTERRISQSETLAQIADLGTVADSLGGDPYHIARSATTGSRSANSNAILQPHQLGNSAARPRTMIGMDEEVASEFARTRSRQRNKGSSGHYMPYPGGLNDRDGIPGKVMRPQSMFNDVPPVPALPTKEEISSRSQSFSKPFKASRATFEKCADIPGKLNRAQSMYVDIPPVPVLPTKQQVAQWEAQISKTNSTRSSTLPPPLQIKRPAENMKDNESAGNAEPEKQEKPTDPVVDWEYRQEGRNQRRQSAGDALLLRFQALSNSKSTILPSPSSGRSEYSAYTSDTRPSSSSSPGSIELSQKTGPPFEPLPERQDTPSSQKTTVSSSESFRIPRKKVASTAAAFEPLTGRYTGGLSYGYEPGLGLGGSAGTRSATTSASRKSVDVSRGYGIDLSDIPIFVTPS